jgi:hypothetical protein
MQSIPPHLVSLRSISRLSFHIRLCFPSGLFQTGYGAHPASCPMGTGGSILGGKASVSVRFSDKNFMLNSHSLVCGTYSVRPTLLRLMTMTILCEGCRFWSFLLCNFHNSHDTATHLVSNFSWVLWSKTHSVCAGWLYMCVWYSGVLFLFIVNGISTLGELWMGLENWLLRIKYICTLVYRTRCMSCEAEMLLRIYWNTSSLHTFQREEIWKGSESASASAECLYFLFCIYFNLAHNLLFSFQCTRYQCSK